MIQTSNELLLSNHETARAHQKSSEIKRKSPYPKPITYDPMTPPICPQHIASWPLPLIQGTSRHQLPWHSQGCTKPDSWTKGSRWRDVSKSAEAKALVIAKKHQETHDGHISWVEKPIQNHVFLVYICLKHPKDIFLKQFKNAVVSPALLFKFFELTISAKVSVQSFRSQINPWITHPGES